MQNGGPDGLALVYNGTTVVQFLSYEGSFTATEGTANGLISTDIGESETSATNAGHSLQLSGSGLTYTDFSWQTPASSTYGNLNNGQIFTATASNTVVKFTTNSSTVNEGDGTYDLEFSIANEDVLNATSFDIVLTSGDSADVNNYTTQSVTFPAGTNTNQTVTVTITDDMLEELNEVLTFEIQNVTGGNNAAAGTPSSFDLTINDNDSTILTTGNIDRKSVV